MCLGLPMQLVELEGPVTAVCRSVDGSELRRIDLTLVGEDLSPGDWILVHVDIALRSLQAGEAQQIHDALGAVSAAASGLPFEHLIQDLVDREPQLPPHLRPGVATGGSHQEVSDD